MKGQFTSSLSSFRFASTIKEEDLIALGLEPQDADAMVNMVQQMAQQKDGLNSFNWSELKPVDVETLLQYDRLPPVGDEDKYDVLSRFAIVKLNGGIGSTMGLKTPKALLPIQGSETFLSAVVTSVASLNSTFNGLSVPLVLMNSFATHAETMKALLAIDVPPSVKIMHFMQRKFPRLNPATLRPLPTSAHSQNDFWYPPGHGDVFEMIVRSGVAEKLIAQGTMYAFVSNIDNPGADLDPTIAGEMIRSDAKFLLEYTPRTPNDRSGGIMVQINGHTSCLELSQVPDTVLPQFGSLDYSAFNTNNMWMHLPTVINLVNSRQLRLRASVVLREMGSSEVLQLETAISSLHGVLEQGPLCLAVPRKRWRVIKTTADLLMVRAPRLLKLHKGRLVIHEARRIPGLPTIKWGAHFRTLKELESRIPFPPDMVDLVHLSVEGDVRFGRNVKLAGTVILIASSGDKLFIPDGAVLRDNIVIGSLTMTPH